LSLFAQPRCPGASGRRASQPASSAASQVTGGPP
jgi:hypothetical protein